MKQQRRKTISRGLSTALAGGTLLLGVSSIAQAQSLFFEGFEGLKLGPKKDEGVAGTKVWTKTAPSGWIADDSGIPGVWDPSVDGVTEWAGWGFADKNWWVTTAGGQRRSEWTFGTGTVMIADPDEWDDAAHVPGLFNTFITTPVIAAPNVAANSLVLAFDSSWRPEFSDDGLPNFPVDETGRRLNNQTGKVLVSYNGQPFVEVLKWDSDPESPTFKKDGDFINEQVLLPLGNPAGVTKMSVKFGMVDAANDWWWAVDNIALGIPPFLTGVSADGVSFSLKIAEIPGKTVDLSKPVTVELDGKAVSNATVSREADRVTVSYSQSPEVFAPGSVHEVKVKFTSADGRQLVETTRFTAPGYSVAAATPTTVTATITESAWLQVAEARGIKLALDGAVVATGTVTRADTKVNVTYTLPNGALFASGSGHTLQVTFTTAAGKEVVETVEFTAPKYATIPSSLATAVGTGRDAGMKWKTHQLPSGRATTVAGANAQLKGQLGASEHDTAGQDTSGVFPIEFVNFEQSGVDAGNFKASAETLALGVPDTNIPGIPGINGGVDNIAGEALAYVELPKAGLYSMVVNSDDGFRVSVGNASNPEYLVLGEFDGGRGASDTTFYFTAQQPGVVQFRLLWFEGTGGASVEWFTVNADGSRALVNGTQTGALKAFRNRTVAEPVITDPGTGTGGTGTTTTAQTLFFEGFEGLILGPNVDEGRAGTKVWTKTAPAGWLADDSGVPGVWDRAVDGVTEWAGWGFANKDWWVATAGGQRRSEWTFGTGTVMIADPDEWDDAAHVSGLLNTYITTPVITAPNVAANSLVLAFDSSWRPEFSDDGLPNFPVDETGRRLNNQTGKVLVSYNGQPFVEVLKWDSDPESPTFKKDGDFINEQVLLPLGNPAGVTKLSVKFGMVDAANDWWWAVDNIAVGVPPLVTGVIADGVSFSIKIGEIAGKTVDLSKPITVELDGKVVVASAAVRENDRVVINYNQSPEVFAPGSTHTVKVKFTNNEGRQVEDMGRFTAPGYSVASATPTTITATITEPAWLTVAEARGIRFVLDGTPVTASGVTRTDATVSARYTLPNGALFASGSIHALQVIFTTGAGKEVSETLEVVAPAYSTIPGALATALGTGREAGMKWKTHQLPTGRATTIAAANAQLAGQSGASEHDTAGQGAGGIFAIDFVNFEQSGVDAGNFKASAETLALGVPDSNIPGIPGVNGGVDNIAGEALAYVELPQAGLYSMVVNSDDGFQVSVGNASNPEYLVLGKFDGGRGSADTTFYFTAQQPGVVLFRLLWFEGTGGASVEWFTMNADGSRALVNGTQAGALKAYRVRTVSEPTLPDPNAQPAGRIASVALQSGAVVIHYTGTLSSANEAAGPYVPVAGASSPYRAQPTAGRQFFIAK